MPREPHVVHIRVWPSSCSSSNSGISALKQLGIVPAQVGSRFLSDSAEPQAREGLGAPQMQVGSQEKPPPADYRWSGKSSVLVVRTQTSSPHLCEQLTKTKNTMRYVNHQTDPRCPALPAVNCFQSLSGPVVHGIAASPAPAPSPVPLLPADRPARSASHSFHFRLRS